MTEILEKFTRAKWLLRVKLAGNTDRLALNVAWNASKTTLLGKIKKK